MKVVFDASTTDDLLRGLDSTQRAAVASDAPLLAIIAGAGSGKTRVLTHRVAHRCLTGTADASHVAVLTFTRQAANELRRRLRSLGIRDGVIAGTFHSVALSLLRQRWDEQRRSHPVIVADRRRLIGEVLGPTHSARTADYISDIDWARARNITPRRYASAVAEAGRSSSAPVSEVVKVMTAVQALKTKRGVIDLDDLLSLTIEAMQSDTNFANIVRWKIRHLFVDEAQDLNPLQIAVLDEWRSGRDDLTLVGDPSQSIYGFNGADPSVLSILETRFPGIEVIRLTANYRCTPQVVSAGLTALSHLNEESPKLFSARSDGVAVKICSFADEKDEASGIARLIESWRHPMMRWSDVAILARTNAQLPALREALVAIDITARILGTNATDPIQRAIQEVGDLPSATRISVWSRDMRSPHVDADNEDDDVEDVIARRRVVDAVDEFLKEGGGDGRTFLTWVRTNRPFEDDRQQHAVELLTFHGSKGREWDNVVLAGCEQGFMPHSSAKSGAEHNEEVRLAYVAITRAADQLVLTHAQSRRGRQRTRSPFIEGLILATPPSSMSADYIRDQEIRRESRVQVDPVYESLWAWRTQAGRTASIKPQILCTDEVLRRIASVLPTTIEELSEIPGVGKSFAFTVGKRILDAIQDGLNQPSV